MRYYLVAGEASGDLHGSLLIQSLKRGDPFASFNFVGGDLMEKESGNHPFLHFKWLSFMGFLEVIKNIRTILKNLNLVYQNVLDFKPDVLILIDFPGFNLRLASKVKKLGIPIYYYISPKVWAWNSKRVIKIKRDIDRMLVIFPFEVDFYQKWGMQVDYVGNPIMDAIEDFQKSRQSSPLCSIKDNLGLSKPLIALLPGSRKQEIDKILPIMMDLIPHLPEFDFVIAGAPALSKEYYAHFIGDWAVPVTFSHTYDLLVESSIALVTSGTATLETALLNVPEVVLYKTSDISYQIAKRVIQVPFISLVNLIMNREIVQELIQDECNVYRILDEIKKLKLGEPDRDQMLKDYLQLQIKVGRSGASSRAADKMVEYLRKIN